MEAKVYAIKSLLCDLDKKALCWQDIERWFQDQPWRSMSASKQRSILEEIVRTTVVSSAG
jgi:hypothetical protein